MFALQFHEYGEPDVLQVGEAPEPHARPGQVRIAVRAASVNAIDWKIRAGYVAELMPVQLPAIPGVDAAGVVDEVGEMDVVGGLGAVPDLVAITGDARQVVSIADFSAGEHGAHVADGSGARAGYALADAAALHAEGRFAVTVAGVYPLAQGAAAHRVSQGGHVRGKLVLTVP